MNVFSWIRVLPIEWRLPYLELWAHPRSEGDRQSAISLIRQHPRLPSTIPTLVIETLAELVMVVIFGCFPNMPISMIRQHSTVKYYAPLCDLSIEWQLFLLKILYYFLRVMKSLYPWCGKHKPWFCVSYFISCFWALVPYFILLSSLKIAGGHWAWYNNGQNNTTPTQAALLTILAPYYCWCCWPYLPHTLQKPKHIDTMQHGPSRAPSSQILVCVIPEQVCNP